MNNLFFSPIGVIIISIVSITILVILILVLRTVSKLGGGSVKTNLKDKSFELSFGGEKKLLQKEDHNNQVSDNIKKEDISKNNLNHKLAFLILQVIKIIKNIEYSRAEVIKDQLEYIKDIAHQTERVLISFFEESLKNIFKESIVTNTLEFEFLKLLEHLNFSDIKSRLNSLIYEVDFSEKEGEDWKIFKKNFLEHLINSSAMFTEKNMSSLNENIRKTLKKAYFEELNRKLSIAVIETLENLKKISLKYRGIISQEKSKLILICKENNLEEVLDSLSFH